MKLPATKHEEAVSNYLLLKIIISPTLKGVLIFSDFHPSGRGKEGGENH